MNRTALLEFELAYFAVAVQHVSLYATRNPPQLTLKSLIPAKPLHLSSVEHVH